MAEPLLIALAHRGVRVSADGDRLAVRPPGALTPAERAAVQANKAAILCFLDPPAAPWDRAAASAVMNAADAFLVTLPGVHDSPAMAAMAARIAAAFAARDLAGVVKTCRAAVLLGHRHAATGLASPSSAR